MALSQNISRMDSLSNDALRSFHVFARLLNFTRAAEELSISQPALHTKIQELSKRLGVQLYGKQGRQLFLTVQGEELARFAGEWEERLQEFGERFRGSKELAPVSLAAGQGAYLYLLGPALSQFREAPLRLLSGNAEQILDHLRRGTAHVGVAAFGEVPTDCLAIHLARIHSVLVLPNWHALALAPSLKLEQLEGCRLIVPPPERPQRQMLAAHFRRLGVSWEVAVEANGWELQLHFVKLGLGWAIVNSFCPIPEGFAAVPLPQLPPVDYQVVYLKGFQRDSARTLVEQITAKP